MAHRIEYKARCIPYEELESSDHTLYESLSSEVNKKLGGRGSSTQNRNPFDGPADRQGYGGGAPYYLQASYSTQTAISDEVTVSFIYIKNTGFAYSSTAALGSALDLSLKVMAGATDKECIAVLEPNGGMFLPCNTGDNLSCRNIYIQTVNHNGTATTAGSLAVEFFVGGVDNGRAYGILYPFEIRIFGSGN